MINDALETETALTPPLKYKVDVDPFTEELLLTVIAFPNTLFVDAKMTKVTTKVWFSVDGTLITFAVKFVLDGDAI